MEQDHKRRPNRGWAPLVAIILSPCLAETTKILGETLVTIDKSCCFRRMEPLLLQMYQQSCLFCGWIFETVGFHCFCFCCCCCIAFWLNAWIIDFFSLVNLNLSSLSDTKKKPNLKICINFNINLFLAYSFSLTYTGNTDTIGRYITMDDVHLVL